MIAKGSVLKRTIVDGRTVDRPVRNATVEVFEVIPVDLVSSARPTDDETEIITMSVATTSTDDDGCFHADFRSTFVDGIERGLYFRVTQSFYGMFDIVVHGPNPILRHTWWSAQEVTEVTLIGHHPLIQASAPDRADRGRHRRGRRHPRHRWVASGGTLNRPHEARVTAPISPR